MGECRSRGGYRMRVRNKENNWCYEKRLSTSRYEFRRHVLAPTSWWCKIFSINSTRRAVDGRVQEPRRLQDVSAE